jgi:uroporphyrinogen-III synthase
MTASPTTGRRVVVTRSADQASRLSEGLRRAGMIPVEVPLIEMRVTDQHRTNLRVAVADLGRFDWVTLTSPNAARLFCFEMAGMVGSAQSDRRPLSAEGFRPQIAVVGPGTAEVVRDFGIAVDLKATTASAEGLLAEMGSLAPARVLCPQAAGARTVLVDSLIDLGWDVTVVVSYETIAVVPTAEVLAEVADCDAIAFASSSSVEAWAQAHPGVNDLSTLTPALVVSIGPQTTATATAHGFAVAAEAHPHTIDGLVAAVEAALGLY